MRTDIFSSKIMNSSLKHKSDLRQGLKDLEDTDRSQSSDYSILSNVFREPFAWLCTNVFQEHKIRQFQAGLILEE